VVVISWGFIVLILIMEVWAGVLLLGFPGGFHQPKPDNIDHSIGNEDEEDEDDDTDVGGKVADNDCKLNLEYSELPGSPDVSASLQPVNLGLEDTEGKEAEESSVNHHGTLDDPHGEPIDILEHSGLFWVRGRRGEGTGDEESQQTKYQPPSWVCQDDPDGHVRGHLLSGLPDEPDIGQHHGQVHNGVEGADNGHTLPVGEECATEGLDPLPLWLLVVAHANHHQQEADSHLITSKKHSL